MANSEKEPIQNRTHWCHLRLTENEHNILKKKLTTTTCHQISDYVRRVLFECPVTVKHRDQSMDDFMNELIALRRELNALGNNFNQVVKKINSVKTTREIGAWLPVAETQKKELLEKVNHIQERINQFSATWFAK